MIENRLIKNLFIALQESMMNDLKMSQAVSHPTDKGDIAEINWQTWFSTYLPKRYSVTKGKVIDCNGNESDQIDIIIYDRQYSPLVFSYQNVTYITAESVYAVFEVKQELNKENILYAAKKAKSVRELKRTSAKIVYSTGLKDPKPLHKIIAGILTTKCNWTNPESQIKKHVKSLHEAEELDIVCSLDKISSKIAYKREEESEYPTISISKSQKDNALMNLFLVIMTQLQIIGTVPAIEYNKYFNDVPSLEEIYNDSNH